MERLKQHLRVIIFGVNTPAGRAFDIGLILFILLSVILVMYETTLSHSHPYWLWLIALEWVFTGIFTLEYLLRVWISQKKLKYVLSLYGMIDLLSILPSYLGLMMAGSGSLVVVRLLRVLRIFRILRLYEFNSQSRYLIKAMVGSWRKIFIFMVFMLTLVSVFGSILYVVEGPERGFTSIPKSMYWAVVTITTVGYGDIVPQTVFGKFIASVMMLTGYAILAVPTGIVTSEMMGAIFRDKRIICKACNTKGHDPEAHFCRNCGASLPPTEETADARD